MKLIILSPNTHLIFSEAQKNFLWSEFDVEYLIIPEPLDTILSLQSDEEKIVAIDPDFCDWKVTGENLRKMNGVKAICLGTTSFHYVEGSNKGEELSGRWIAVTNLRWFSTNAVAEQALMMTFALARKLPIIIQDNWKIDFEKFRGFELRGKRVGIIWLGRIGTRIAELTQSLGMEVSYWSQESRDDRFNYKDIHDLLSSSDVLYYTLAANSQTEGFFTDENISYINPKAIFVSIVHMQQKVFTELVKLQKLAGYACDDFIGTTQDFLWYNILPWANSAWCTDECFKRNGEQWTEAIMYARKWEFPNKVN